MKIKKTQYSGLTAAVVLDKIKELLAKRNASSAVTMVRVDTLSLIFSLKPVELMPFLSELEANGEIQITPATTGNRPGISQIRLLGI